MAKKLTVEQLKEKALNEAEIRIMSKPRRTTLRPIYPYGKHIGTIINDIQKYYSELPPLGNYPIVEFEFNGLIITVKPKD